MDITSRIALVGLFAPLILQVIRARSAWFATHTDAVKVLAILVAIATALLLDWMPDGKLQAGNLIMLSFAQIGTMKLGYDWIISTISTWPTIRAAQVAAKEATK